MPELSEQSHKLRTFVQNIQHLGSNFHYTMFKFRTVFMSIWNSKSAWPFIFFSESTKFFAEINFFLGRKFCSVIRSGDRITELNLKSTDMQNLEFVENLKFFLHNISIYRGETTILWFLFKFPFPCFFNNEIFETSPKICEPKSW